MRIKNSFRIYGGVDIAVTIKFLEAAYYCASEKDDPY